jgi:putative transposase
VLLRLAYLGVTNAFALLRLLAVSDRDEEMEILALRHQIAVLERQLGTTRPRFCPGDRAFLAALLHRFPGDVLSWFRLLVRRRRCSLAPGPAGAPPCGQVPSQAPRPAGHRPLHPPAGASPGTGESLLGLPPIHGELLVLEIRIAASNVWEILRQAGIDPAPERASTTWAKFLRSQADALLACDFFETVTLSGVRLYVLAAIEHASRRIRILGATPHPTACWVVQATKNLVMDLEDAGSRARFLIGTATASSPACLTPWPRTPASKWCSAGAKCRE